jgi:uncharacterized repeat protein (TIGR03847 family)
VGETFELDPADSLGAGAIGEPGERSFYLQARKESAQLTVLVEKEQVALLAAEAGAFLDQLDVDYPEEQPPEDDPLESDPPESDPLESDPRAATLREPAVPLFRAQAIGIGFDPQRSLMLIELRERAKEHDEDLPQLSGSEVDPIDSEEEEGWVARIYATRSQVRAMLVSGAAAVVSGRPPCPLCDQPMDPEGHICPRWN